MKIAISVPNRVSKAADETAKRLRIPRSQLYTRAVETLLRELGHSDVTERLNAVYSKRSNRPDPAVLRQGLETLRLTEWDE